MDLQLPITTVNGEPIETLVLALPPLVRAMSARVDALVRGEPYGRLVLAPCVRRALLPIWIERCEDDDVDLADLGPAEFFSLLITVVDCLVDQVDEAVRHNLLRAAA